MSRPSGMTLVETMVASFLIMLATTLLYTFFASFGRQMLRYEKRQELLREADRYVVRLQSVWSDAHSAYAVAESSIAGIYLPVAEDSAGTLKFDSDGNLMWQAWEAFGYDSANSRAYEARLPLATASSTPPAVPLSLPASWARSTLCNKVKSFSLSGPSNNALTVNLLLRDDNGYYLQFSSTAVARN